MAGGAWRLGPATACASGTSVARQQAAVPGKRVLRLVGSCHACCVLPQFCTVTFRVRSQQARCILVRRWLLPPTPGGAFRGLAPPALPPSLPILLQV